MEMTVNDGRKMRPKAEYTAVIDKPHNMFRKKRADFIYDHGKTLLSSRHVNRWLHWIELQGSPEPLVRWWEEKVIVFEAHMYMRTRNRQLPDPRLGSFCIYDGTPYIACQLAMYMGFSRINLIGVDYVDHPDFNKAKVQQISWWYDKLRRMGTKVGCQVYNCSPISRVKSLERKSLREAMKEAVLANQHVAP